MGSYIFLLIVIILSLRAVKKKNKMPGDNQENRRSTVQTMETEERRPRRTEKVSQRRINPSKGEVKPEVAQQTKISQRIEKQHSEYDRSRIHQEVHKKEEPPVPSEVMMEKVKELIVCGYPTEIPGQRDFVKEGEDFLASLSTNNTFF